MPCKDLAIIFKSLYKVKKIAWSKPLKFWIGNEKCENLQSLKQKVSILKSKTKVETYLRKNRVNITQKVKINWKN